MSIDPTDIKSWQPTRATVGAALASQANAAQRRKECVALGYPGYISSTSNEFGKRGYRERWPYTKGDQTGSFKLDGQCNFEAPTTLDVVLDYGCLYSPIGGGGLVSHEGANSYDKLKGKSVQGGVFTSVDIHQWQDGGAYRDLGGATDALTAATYYLPERLASHLTAVQSHCVQFAEHSFCYREGLTTPWGFDANVGKQQVVSVALDSPYWDPSLPFIISVDFRAYLTGDTGLGEEYPKWGDDASEHEGETPDNDYYNIWVLGVSAWVY